MDPEKPKPPSKIEVLQSEIRDLKAKHAKLKSARDKAELEADDEEYEHQVSEEKRQYQREIWLMERGRSPDSDICTPYDRDRECHNEECKIHSPYPEEI